jgi:hypothetical protein
MLLVAIGRTTATTGVIMQLLHMHCYNSTLPCLLAHSSKLVMRSFDKLHSFAPFRLISNSSSTSHRLLCLQVAAAVVSYTMEFVLDYRSSVRLTEFGFDQRDSTLLTSQGLTY